jgi:glycosyltransferase involved in cell wall biosynthesis
MQDRQISDKSNKIGATLIIAFYNRPDILDLTMAGLRRQTTDEFEVIIADDGSNRQVVDHINRATAGAPFPVRHIWQEDHGFRKNRILNRAVLKASSDYLVFIDMDCIPHSEFVREHFQNREEGYCLTGRRVNLSQRISDRLTPALIAKGYLESRWPLLVYDGIFGKSRDVEKGFYVRSPALRRLLNTKSRGLLGCNFSLFRHDLMTINGFDERYQMPSVGEDSDIEFRLGLNGIRIRSLNYMAVQYHLYHPPSARPQKNIDLFNTVKSQKIAFTPYGISQKDGTFTG